MFARFLMQSYSIKTDTERLRLRAPVADKRIFFAGEATHPTHPATVVGAIHEGERAALEVHAANGSPGNAPLQTKVSPVARERNLMRTF